MSRPVTGDTKTLELARAAIARATSIEQLRQAQSVVLPLDYGLSLEETAAVIGVSKGWACQLRRRFMRSQLAGDPALPARGGRKRQNMSKEEEKVFLAPFLAQASSGGVLVVGQIKAALDRVGPRQADQVDVPRRGAIWTHLGCAQVLGVQAHSASMPSHALMFMATRRRAWPSAKSR